MWSKLNIDMFSRAIKNSQLGAEEYISRLNENELDELYDEIVSSILNTLVPTTQATIVKTYSDVWFNEKCRSDKQLCRKLETIRQYKSVSG